MTSPFSWKITYLDPFCSKRKQPQDGGGGSVAAGAAAVREPRRARCPRPGLRRRLFGCVSRRPCRAEIPPPAARGWQYCSRYLLWEICACAGGVSMRRCASSAPWPPSRGGMEPGALPLSIRLREALSGGECEHRSLEEDPEQKDGRSLLQQGADPNLVLPEGIAGIHLAAGMEQESGIRCLALILRYGGDPNIRSVDGLTPLHVAAAWGCYTCLKLLLMEGGGPPPERPARLRPLASSFSQDGNTAIDLALEEGNEMCLQILQGFPEEAGEGEHRWMSYRREESFLSTVTEDTLNPGGSSRLYDACPILSGGSLRPPPDESLQHAKPTTFLSRPSKSQDKTCSFEDRIAFSFLTECSLASSTLSNQGDLCAQPAASSCLGGVLGQLAPSPLATRGFHIGGPEPSEPDLGAIQIHQVQSTTAKGSPLPPAADGAFPPSTLINRKLRASLEVQNSNRSREIPGPSPTHAVVSESEADPVASRQDPNATFNLSQYGSFLDPDLVVRATGHEGLDVTSPDHAYLFTRENAAAVSDLEKTVVVNAELLPSAGGNLGGGSERDESFSESSSSGQYASCDSECYASGTEALLCSETQTQEGREAAFSCSTCSSHNTGSSSLMSEFSLGPASRGPVSSSGETVEAFNERNSPAGSDCLRHLCDRIACSCRTPFFAEVGKPRHKLSAIEGNAEAKDFWSRERAPFRNFLSHRWKRTARQAKGSGSPEAQERLSTEDRRGFHCTSTKDVEEHLWAAETVLIQKASEETSSPENESPVPPGMNWDAAETMPIPHQTPPSTREEEPAGLEAKLRSMMLATKVCHSPLLQPHQSPRHVTPRTKSRMMATATHSASSSSSLFDETLEMPQRPRRWRNPGGLVPASGERQDRPAGPRNSSLPGAAGSENGELDDTVLIGAGLGSCSGSLPSGCPLISLDTPGSSGRDVCGGYDRPDTKCGSDRATDSEEELPLKGDKPPPGNGEETCAARESLDAVLSRGQPERLSAKPGRTKRQANRSRVSFSRLPARGPPVPRASTCPSGRMSPVVQDVQLSPGGRPVNLSAAEPVEYLYEDEGHTLVERHIPCTDDSVANTTSSEDTVIYDWRAYTGQAVRPPDAGGCSPPAPSDLSHLSDEALVRQLRDFGVNPGPVTGLTRKIYLQLLEKLMSDPKTKARKGSAGYSPELSTALDTYQIPDGQEDEMALSRQFDQPDKSRKWREGLLKSSFNYLLLDPRVTQNLPPSAASTSAEPSGFRTFISAIFYVGKGKRSRPYCHLYELPLTHYQQSWKRQVHDRVRHILDIWASGQGVISMHCFQNVIPVEAYTREACMVDAIGKGMLTNQKRGNYYGIMAGWPMKRRRCLGIHLLHRAMQIFLAEGERQLRPADIRTGQ
ncbi:LOW QUALITY PROTEIN: ankyrin repeat and LEM domain-containing protein 1 [Lacerta agilis]|uniref:LOW QUALITY PROTEIN: ankyrin repeat and LEM domain-containing protein 1 n=1 Tax=Lacerta agilis TaxID=80427 RepID=UPI001419D5E7|nr:LOW QUALITY PROTEIN: ankyrin repeat and LEM domain-containing protein 1 [Lacerta agilis]